MENCGGDRAALAYAMARAGVGTLRTLRRLGGHGRRVYECESEPGAAIIARVSDRGRDAFDVELAVAARLRAAGVPVPPFRGLVELTLDAPRAVLLQEKSSGQTLRSFASATPSRRGTDSVERAGELLARIHSCSTSGFGPLVSAERGQAARLSEWFVDGIDPVALRTRNSDPYLAEQTAHALSLIAAHRTVLDRCSPGLVHGDWSPDNVLVDEGGKPVAVVDFEAAKSGPPALDLGWWDCMFDSPATPSDALVRGYQRVDIGVDSQTVSALRHLTVLRVTLLFAAWAADRPDVPSEWASERLNRELSEAPRWSAV